MVEDDDDSDYGHSKKRGKKVIRRGRTDKKDKKSPKPRLKATGKTSAHSVRERRTDPAGRVPRLPAVLHRPGVAAGACPNTRPDSTNQLTFV